MSAPEEVAEPTTRVVAWRADETDPASPLVIELRRLTDTEAAALPLGEIDASALIAPTTLGALDYALFQAMRSPQTTETTNSKETNQ
ncbi:hypothetical protein [Microbacterium capsulatum]|uniref:Uncharacterized protein n=1 Tax=Microbacterium capsulatum TaxID=3041921 RepID=A0ABU0XBJ9_9MICO|nr:hypothetical protein [Microbacterium sp. ASV81]MDQ4212469.1 hypothetical protein [Microbacterium sp. ASV81]